MKPLLLTNHPQSKEQVQPLAHNSCSALYALAVYKAISLHVCVVIATKPMHQLQTQMAVANIYLASAMPHVNCNKRSAVAEMGDRGHNRHGLKQGGCCAPFVERWEPV